MIDRKKAKKAVDIKIDEKAVPEQPKSSSELKKYRQAVVDAYKIQNPTKYKMKRDALKIWVNKA